VAFIEPWFPTNIEGFMDQRTSPQPRLGLLALCIALCAAAPLSSTAQPSPDERRLRARVFEGPSIAPPNPDRRRSNDRNSENRKSEDRNSADRNSDRRPSDTSDSPRPHRSNGSRIPWWEVVVAACAVTDCLRAGTPAAGTQAASAPTSRDLLQNGPQTPKVLPEGTFPIYGFIRNGWPMVADYKSQTDSITWLTVSVPGAPVWSQRLPSGEHLVKVIYTDGDAPRSAVALIALQSRAETTGDEVIPLPIEVFGLGAGPRAVGSVAINGVNFALSARQLGGDFARFGYIAESDFNAVDMEILRFAPERHDGRRVITATTVAQYRTGAVRRGPFGPRMWDGREQKSQRASTGRHRLQVRGWEVEGDESWVTALSPSDVLVP
jgi:hypothetical protein